MTDLYLSGLVSTDVYREANGFPGAAVGYPPASPVARGGISYQRGRRFRREGPPPVKPSARRRYGRG